MPHFVARSKSQVFRFSVVIRDDRSAPAQSMNSLYSGTFTKRGVVYDYSGIWKPLAAGVAWKAVVRSTDAVRRPCGVLEDGYREQEILGMIHELIEASVTAPWHPVRPFGLGLTDVPGI